MYRKENKRRKLTNKRILILCEGKTEKFYLENLRNSLPRQLQRDIRLEITNAKESEPKKIIQELKRKEKKARKEKQSYYDSRIVFDDDRRSLNTFFQKIENDKVNFVYNSISVEFWFLLHFKNTSRQFQSSNEVIPELEKAGLKPYSKTDKELWDKLNPNYKTAKKRAEKISSNFMNNNTQWAVRKPYSNFYELVDLVLSLNYLIVFLIYFLISPDCPCKISLAPFS